MSEGYLFPAEVQVVHFPAVLYNLQKLIRQPGSVYYQEYTASGYALIPHPKGRYLQFIPGGVLNDARVTPLALSL